MGALGSRIALNLVAIGLASLGIHGSEKQPNKNFSYCLSCAGSESANTTYGGLETYLKEKGLHLPEFHAHCRESRPAETSGRRSVPIYYCPSGACVKIKGVFQDQTFIVRECWDRLWNQPLRHGWEGCTYFDAMMDTDAHICVCRSNDMCNSGSYCFRSLSTGSFPLPLAVNVFATSTSNLRTNPKL